MNKFFSSTALVALLTVGSLAAAPAFAENIDISLSSSAWNLSQVGVSIAAANGTVEATTANIAGLTSFEGLNTDDTWLSASAGNLSQTAVAGGLSLAYGATTSATNIAGLVTGNIKEVYSQVADIAGVASASALSQEAWSIALADDGAIADATNIAGLIDVTVDVD